MKRTPLRRISSRRAAKKQSAADKKKLRPDRFCSSLRCTQPSKHLGMCWHHADEHMNGLLRKLIVQPDTDCEAADWHRHLFSCGGPIQVNHVFRRGRMLVRWNPDNIIAGCAALNAWAHYNEDHWHHLFRDWRGEAAYKSLEQAAFGSDKVDWDFWHEELHRRLGGSVEQKRTALKAA